MAQLYKLTQVCLQNHLSSVLCVVQRQEWLLIKTLARMQKPVFFYLLFRSEAEDDADGLDACHLVAVLDLIPTRYQRVPPQLLVDGL